MGNRIMLVFVIVFDVSVLSFYFIHSFSSEYIK
jgi:hypothetical protein